MPLNINGGEFAYFKFVGKPKYLTCSNYIVFYCYGEILRLIFYERLWLIDYYSGFSFSQQVMLFN